MPNGTLPGVWVAEGFEAEQICTCKLTEPLNQQLESEAAHNSPMQEHYAKSLMWFRRDLRADDNAALFHALKKVS